nr:integrase, catalytic region, zinc finger, CCHC-type, peptidase aspartic, catalytic [Tanacetum cinerariifolium]
MEILIQTCLMPLAIKTQRDSLKFVHELKQEMHADLKYVESLKKKIEKLKSDKAEFSDMYDVILQECVSKDVMCSYLQSLSDFDALAKLQFEKHLISLEIALQNCKERVKNDTVCNEKASNVFRKEREQYFEIQDLKAQMQDKNIAISDLKKLIEKAKGKSMDTKFDKPYVVRQPNAQRILKPSVLGKPTPFSNSLDRIYFQKTRSVSKANVPKGLSKPVTAQTLPHTGKKAVRVNHNTNVSRPQLKSNQSKDKVLSNNSQVKVKKTQVEVHPKIPSVSNKMKSVTACKDNLNSRTLNANALCATCNKCLIDSNHFACVTKMLNDVHARTKKPTVVPISTRRPKNQANKSIATPNKKKGNDLLLGNHGFDLYIISLQESTSTTPLCLMAKATPTQAWLWHQRLSHLNFDYINLLSKKDIVIGLPKLKYVKD